MNLYVVDSFQRFKHSKTFLELAEKYKRDLKEKKALEEHNLV